MTFNVLIPFQREASEGSQGWFLKGVAECVLDHMYKRSKSYWSEALIAPLISRYCYSVAVKLMRGIFFHHCYFCYYTYYYYHHHQYLYNFTNRNNSVKTHFHVPDSLWDAMLLLEKPEYLFLWLPILHDPWHDLQESS